MSTTDFDGRGTLFPNRLPPRFRRVVPDADCADLVVWWWISEWQLPEGESSPQHLLAFPASNLVVEDVLVGFSGPTTRASTRVLTGTGWALGALLRPAAVPAFTDDPAAIRNRYLALPAGELHAEVTSLAAHDVADAIPVVARWLSARVGPLDDEALLANLMAEACSNDPTVTSLADLARTVGVSQRTLHRLARRYVGISPYAMIRRRRLQEAAQAVRTEPERPLAELAAEHGFVDQAHLTREFRSVLGRTPATYREQAASHDAAGGGR